MRKMTAKHFLLVLAGLVMVFAALPMQAAQAEGQIWVAFTGRDGNIYLMRSDGSDQRPLTADARTWPGAEQQEGGQIGYDSLRWSPDGHILASVRTEGKFDGQRLNTTSVIMLQDITKGTIRKIEKEILAFAWKPDGSGLIYAPLLEWTPNGPKNVQGIRQVDINTLEDTEFIKPERNHPLILPRFSPDGRYLAFYEVVAMEGLGPFAHYDLQDKVYRAWDQQGDQVVGHVDWLPDGSGIVFDRNTYTPAPNERIWKADPLLKQVTPLTPENQNMGYYSPVVSPQGDRVLFLGAQYNIETPGYPSLWVTTTGGSNLREVFKPNQNVYFFQWLPDGQKIIFSMGEYKNEEIHVLDLNTGQATKVALGWMIALQPEPAGIGTSPEETATAVQTEVPNEQVTPEPVQAVTPMLTPTALMPPDRIAPPMPSIGRAEVLIIVLFCCGGLGLLALIVAVVVVLLRQRK